jgi:hypothetical protein
MTEAYVEVRYIKRDRQHMPALDKATRDALADYCRDRFPAHTAKMVAREWDLSVDEARGVVAGRSSFATYDKVKKAGGWPVILAVEAAVVGHGIDQFLERTGASHDRHAERLAALLGGGGPVPPSRSPDPARLDL